mmetsp:Transcript_110500/g.276676  ORF Transcript_110500/g.276676 Transcript_110500/m.276676 type:complete len:229 (+) Transcript_110500:177-863(+)
MGEPLRARRPLLLLPWKKATSPSAPAGGLAVLERRSADRMGVPKRRGAPAVHRARTVSWCPFRCAICRGVSPKELQTSVSARISTRYFALCATPLRQSNMSGDSPRPFKVFKLAPSSTSSFTAGAGPVPGTSTATPQAKCNGVSPCALTGSMSTPWAVKKATSSSSPKRAAACIVESRVCGCTEPQMSALCPSIRCTFSMSRCATAFTNRSGSVHSAAWLSLSDKGMT